MSMTNCYRWLTIVIVILWFTLTLVADELVVGSPEWIKQKKILWNEYMKWKRAVDDTDQAPIEIQIETQQKKLEAADKLVQFGDRLNVVRSIAAWQYNNMGKLYINAFELYSEWSLMIEKLYATTNKKTKKALRAEMYKKAEQYLMYLDQALIYLEKAKELNLLSSNKTRTEKINNNLAYVYNIFAWLNFYNEDMK